MGFMKERVPTYDVYAHTTFEGLFTKEEANEAIKLQANWFYSSYIENLGNDTFSITPLPSEAQFAPIYGILVKDVNTDGKPDALLVGNDYGNDVFWGRYDAFNGLWLKGTGDHHFQSINYPESGFFVPGDAKAIVDLPIDKNEQLIIASQNMDSLRVFKLKDPQSFISLKDDDAWGMLEMNDGRLRKEEFYYGHSFLSQSARVLYLPEDLKKLTLYSFQGEKRIIDIADKKR
jgi:hypothetical protein